MFAFVICLAAVASLHAASKHLGETDLTSWPHSNKTYDNQDEGSYLSAMEKAGKKEASVQAKFKHAIALFNKNAKQLPLEKRENITKKLQYIFLKLKKYLESRHPSDQSTLNTNTDDNLLDVLSSKHLNAKTKQFVRDLQANKTFTHSLISLPSIHPLLLEFDNEGVKREKIKPWKVKDESEEENENDYDKYQEVETDSAGMNDLNEDSISIFAQFPKRTLFDDENEIPQQNNQNILSVSHVAPANSWSHIQSENNMHGNRNPEIAFNDLLASSTHMDENTNLFSELNDIFGFSEEENEAVEKKQRGRGDLSRNTFSSQVMLSNAVEKLSDNNKNKDDSKHLHEKSVSEQFLHPNSIQKAIQNAIQFEDNHISNLKRSQNVHHSSDIGSDRNLIHNIPKSKMPDTFLASSLQRIHTLDADRHFKEIPDPEKEIKALENLLKLAEGFSGPKNQQEQSFQNQNNFFIPLGDDKMFLQFLQGDGGDVIKEDEQWSESEEENVLQTNIENRNSNRVLKGNSANGGDEEISLKSSSKNSIAALFPMEKQPEISVINFSGSQKKQKKESSEEIFKEKPMIFRHDVLLQSRPLETEANGLELTTENSKESEEVSTSVVLSGRQQGHHIVNSDVENIESVEAIRNFLHIPEHSWHDDSNSKTRESSESKESFGSLNQRKSESDEQKSSKGQDIVIVLKSSSKSESNEHDLSITEGNIQSSSNSESNEQDSSKSGNNEHDSKISDNNAFGSVNSKSSEQDSVNSGSDEKGLGNSKRNEKDSSISGSNEQDSNSSGISEQGSSNEQDSSNSESNDHDSSKIESNEQDSSNSESKQDSSESESNEQDFKSLKDEKPTTVIVRDRKPDVLQRNYYPQNDIPTDDLVFPIVQHKYDKSYVPNFPEDKRILQEIPVDDSVREINNNGNFDEVNDDEDKRILQKIPVDNSVREINGNWNFDEVIDDLNMVTPITNDDDLFIAIQNIESRLPKDMERNKRQNHYKKKTNYGYNGIRKFTSKYSNSKEIVNRNKHTRYSTNYNDPDFYNIKRLYGGIDSIKSTKYKNILPYIENLYRNDVGYIAPEIYQGQIYRGSFGYHGPNSMYKKATYIGHRLLKLTSKELDELNKIYMDSLGFQTSDLLYQKSTHNGHRLLKLTTKELDELNKIYRATRQYRPTPFAKSRIHHYPVFRGPHRKLEEQVQTNGDRGTGGIFYDGRSLFGRRLFGRRILNTDMTKPRHRALPDKDFTSTPEQNIYRKHI